MKIREAFKCTKCGLVVAREDALSFPTEEHQAEPFPCPHCGEKAWQPTKEVPA